MGRISNSILQVIIEGFNARNGDNMDNINGASKAEQTPDHTSRTNTLFNGNLRSRRQDRIGRRRVALRSFFPKSTAPPSESNQQVDLPMIKNRQSTFTAMDETYPDEQTSPRQGYSSPNAIDRLKSTNTPLEPVDETYTTTPTSPRTNRDLDGFSSLTRPASREDLRDPFTQEVSELDYYYNHNNNNSNINNNRPPPTSIRQPKFYSGGLQQMQRRHSSTSSPPAYSPLSSSPRRATAYLETGTFHRSSPLANLDDDNNVLYPDDEDDDGDYRIPSPTETSNVAQRRSEKM